MVETIVKVWVINKAVELVKTNIYKNEIINVAKTGVEKFNTIVDNFWDKLTDYVKKEKEIDRKWLPDVVEDITEDTALKVIETLKEETDVKEFVQAIFDIEKANNPTAL